jgi:hypothetical protein
MITSVVVALVVLTSAAPPAASDWQAVRRARLALDDDRELAGLSVGVSVANGAATVWGVVPDRPTARRALACVRLALGGRPVADRLAIDNAGDLEPGPPVAAPVPAVVPPARVTSRFAEAPTAVRLGPAIEAPPAAVDDPRFRRLSVREADGAVTVSGRAATWADVWEFAGREARRPGVSAVRVGGVTVDRR